MRKVSLMAATLPAMALLSACDPASNPAEPVKTEVAAPTDAATTPAKPADTAATPAAQSDSHGTRDAVDWNGSYSGTLPCADCSGIKTVLTLNQDGTYAMSETYLGKQDKPFEAKGKFSWDASGSVITLDEAGDKRAYKVGEGQMWALDADGKEITGELANSYILKK